MYSLLLGGLGNCAAEIFSLIETLVGSWFIVILWTTTVTRLHTTLHCSLNEIMLLCKYTFFFFRSWTWPECMCMYACAPWALDVFERSMYHEHWLLESTFGYVTYLKYPNVTHLILIIISCDIPWFWANCCLALCRPCRSGSSPFLNWRWYDTKLLILSFSTHCVAWLSICASPSLVSYKSAHPLLLSPVSSGHVASMHVMMSDCHCPICR